MYILYDDPCCGSDCDECHVEHYGRPCSRLPVREEAGSRDQSRSDEGETEHVVADEKKQRAVDVGAESASASPNRILIDTDPVS